MRIKKIFIGMLIVVSFGMVSCGSSEKDSKTEDAAATSAEIDSLGKNITMNTKSKDVIELINKHNKDVDVVLSQYEDGKDKETIFEGKLPKGDDGIKVKIEPGDKIINYELEIKGENINTKIITTVDYKNIKTEKQDKENEKEADDKKENESYEDKLKDWNSKSFEYKKDDQVKYEDRMYECIQGHISQEAWNPKDAVSLWREFKI